MASSTVAHDGSGDVNVKFLVGKGLEQETITCDKKTLVASSPRFAELVLKNPHSGLTTEWIQLPDEDPIALKNIIRCIQDENVEPCKKKLVATYETARRYQIPAVATRYRRLLLQAVDRFDVAVDTFEAGTRLEDEAVQNRALNFLTIRAQTFIKSEPFKRLSKNGLIALLKCERFLVDSEYQIFSACLEWAKRECLRNEMDPNNYLSLRIIFADVLPLIRFPVIPEAIFHKYIAPMNILEQRDCQLLSHYWTLKKCDPLSAQGMQLPFPKNKRIGKLYEAVVFDRKPLEKNEGLWTVPEGSVVPLKLWSDCTLNLHYLNLFGKPSNGHKTGLVNIHLFEKVRWAGMGGAYHISTSQTAQAYLKAPKILAIEFSPALKIKAGVKYHLDMKFIDFGTMDDSMGKTSGNSWKCTQVPVSGNSSCTFMMKKKDGQDCLPTSVEFTVSYVVTSNGPIIEWSSRHQPRNTTCKIL